MHTNFLPPLVLTSLSLSISSSLSRLLGIPLPYFVLARPTIIQVQCYNGVSTMNLLETFGFERI
ncbi:hypothetical protein MANES_02G223750v8 [Manihot esculenta]|uniref:Uncharacterized protein n=1 Tax=Manihot esculenta TaxID=3983 RepID=A0ACB7IE01_MANES|nr:hypothetical protein MANES_02G223750v8 [Manihot esculenta]